MKTFLLSITTSGIRNIDKRIRVDFYKRSMISGFDPTGDRVRAIYGPNGSGKTSFMLSVWVLAQLLNEKDFLVRQGNDYFSNLFSKSSSSNKSFYIGMEFLTYDYNLSRDLFIDSIDKYEVTLGFDGDDCIIESEKLSRLSNRARRDSWKTVFEVRNGELLAFDTNRLKNYKELITEKTKNLLLKNLFSTLLVEYLAKISSGPSDKSLLIPSEADQSFFALCKFAPSLKVNVMSQDKHLESSYAAKLAFAELQGLEADAFKKEVMKAMELDDGEVKVSKNYFEAYKSFLEKASDFIKLFKPNLSKIKTSEPRVKGNDYIFRRIFVYEDKEIDLSYESSGVQKLFALYADLDSASRGKIVFIDEFDANISGVYLRKIVEYMNEYGGGQLVFTCHSLDPMYALSGNSKSIYFLNEDTLPYAWTKNAHYQPYILYPEGMIPGIPFNLEASDFISVFGDDEES